jgi:O-antigen/teichoic acid export membrane protein
MTPPEVQASPAAGAHIESRGVVWSFVGFAVIGVSGLLVNLIVEGAYGRDELGRFSTLLAIFLVGGQVGVIGVHSSVLFHTAAAAARGEPTAHVAHAALRVVAVSGAASAALIVLGGEVLSALLDSDTYTDGLWAIGIGLLLYPVNKVLVAYVNGMRRIRAVAVLTAMRFVGLVLGVALVAAFDLSPHALPWVVSATEAAIVVTLAVMLRGSWGHGGAPRRMATTHTRFGLRAMPAGLFLDLNTRIDVLVLGALAGSGEVGNYVIASVFAEGLYQLAMVTRYSYDPVVAALHTGRRIDELRRVMRAARRRTYTLVGAVGVVSVLAYPWVVEVLYGDDADGTWIVYAYLAAGVLLSAGFIPFTSMLQQSGDPTGQSILLALISGTNLLLNIVLVPHFGAPGAGLATALAQAALVPYMYVLSRQRLGWMP